MLENTRFMCTRVHIRPSLFNTFYFYCQVNLTEEIQTDVAQYGRSLSTGPLLVPREEPISWLRRLEGKLRDIYATLTCTRTEDVVRHPIGQRPPRPPSRRRQQQLQQQQMHEEQHQLEEEEQHHDDQHYHHEEQTHHRQDPRPRLSPQPRPPPPDQLRLSAPVSSSVPRSRPGISGLRYVYYFHISIGTAYFLCGANDSICRSLWLSHAYIRTPSVRIWIRVGE